MSESKRLFFALELPANVQRQIVRWRARPLSAGSGPSDCGGKPAPDAGISGRRECRKAARAGGHGRANFQPGFTLHLDDAGQWLRSRVVWLGTRQPPRGLLQLASMLRAQAARSGCYQSPQPFHPHITLLRDAGHAVAIPPPGFHWSFPVNGFALYESVFARGRTRYTPLQRWTLATR
ncbi:2'-5' RNA ligase [Enterobacter cancerogenus]|uniref:2'-5' RNA ligase n=1 Tax=Enterobacter cancerogenus TaxID=69218 RepID=A0A484WUD2_9ENTR|nr:2'-5' RNA ligase [Enterobacter cancerogenus]